VQEYITTNIVDIYCGRVGLDESQAARRANSVRQIDPGVYEILTPVQFKAGEKIGLDRPDKAMVINLENLTQKPVKRSVKKPVKKAAKKQ